MSKFLSDRNDIFRIKRAKTRRISSWDKLGRNSDWWAIQPGESKIIADIQGPGLITHIWMTTGQHYREVLIKITWDDAEEPSILCPYGDFFGLGHGIVNSYQSLFFTASTNYNNQFNKGCAMNCYLPMPFKKHAVIELINESDEIHRQYFYVDYELYDDESYLGENWGYLHVEFHRENPFGGWAHEIKVNTPEADIVNKERLAWENNYVILQTRGRGHYIGCNYSITNLQGTWWGEGDDMIWVDGYKWPPDLHGTGSEDYLNQAWGMQPNAFLRNGSSIHENNTGGYQTSYVFHVENPVRFEKEVKVTIEFGHGNHLRNEVSSTAYFYLDKPTAVKVPPSVEKRLPIRKIGGEWVIDERAKITSKEIPLNDEMKLMKERWSIKNAGLYFYQAGKMTNLMSPTERGNGSDDESLNACSAFALKFQISPDNPELFSIPVGEILEDLVEHINFKKDKILVEIYNKNAISDNNDGNVFGARNSPDIRKLLELGEPIDIFLARIVPNEDFGSEIIYEDSQLLKREAAPGVNLSNIFGQMVNKMVEFEFMTISKNILDEKLSHIVKMDPAVKYRMQIRFE